MSFVPGVIAKNWQLKVLAGAMAVLLWTVPRFEAQSSQVLEDVPVRVDLADPNWVLVGDPSPSSVSVTLSGPARDLIAIGVDHPPILVPIGEVSSGDTVVLLSPSWFRSSAWDGVVVGQLRPGAVSLHFERIEERRIPFSVPTFGTPPQGLSLAGAPRINPPMATVFGPAGRFQGVDSIPLVPLDLAQLSDSGSVVLRVDTARLQGLDVLPLEASLEIPTEPTSTRELTDQLLVLPLLNSPPQLQSRPTSVTVVLEGPQSLVDAVDPANLRVTIPRGQATLAPGEEERLVVVVEGLPELVGYRVIPDWVLLRRPVGQ